VSLGSNGRHRRQGLLRRAAPVVATTAGSVALVTTIGTAAFWLVPGDQRVPFRGFGPGSTGAAPPTSALINPTGGSTTGKHRAPDSAAGQPETSASAAAARARQVAASRSSSRAQTTSSTPQPKKTKTKRPTDKPSLPHTTPPPLLTVTTLPFLPVSVTATVSATELP
jgi:hypothetical protein